MLSKLITQEQSDQASPVIAAHQTSHCEEV